MDFFHKIFSKGRSDGKIYDVFISYRVLDVGFVRPIVEQMIASGLKVWFAEYMILLLDRDQFEQAYTMGAEHAKFGICFTNERYLQSQACYKELSLLLNSCGDKNVLEIRLPTEPLQYPIPQLANSPSTEYKSIDQALCFIGETSGLPIKPLGTTESLPNTYSVFQYAGRSFSIDLAGWKVIHQKSSMPDKDGDVKGPEFERSYDRNSAWGHVIIGRQDKNIQRDKVLEDRSYYEYAIEFARHFYGDILRQKGVGVHALFHENVNFRQNAFTTKFMPGVWSRLYSIVLPDPDSHQDIEIAFFFFFLGKFTEFCRYAYYLDRIVGSLKQTE